METSSSPLPTYRVSALDNGSRGRPSVSTESRGRPPASTRTSASGTDTGRRPTVEIDEHGQYFSTGFGYTPVSRGANRPLVHRPMKRVVSRATTRERGRSCPVERSGDGDIYDPWIGPGSGVMPTGDGTRGAPSTSRPPGSSAHPRESEACAAGQRHEEFGEEQVARPGAREGPVRIETRKDNERDRYGRWPAVTRRRDDGAPLGDGPVADFGGAVRCRSLASTTGWRRVL